MSSTTTANRRKTRRYRIPTASEACVEFAYPQPNGTQWSLRLVDISHAGFSFDVTDLPVELEIGCTLNQAVLRVGQCEMHGDLLIMHVTPESAVCGALFYPDTDTDLLKLRSFIAGIEAVQAD